MKYGDCPEMYGENTERRCVRCGAALTGRQQSWCGQACVKWWDRNHWFNAARAFAIYRASIFDITYGCPPSARCSATVVYAFDLARYLDGTSEPHTHMAGDPVCEICGAVASRPEVDHIERAKGKHGIASCIHHVTNLRVLDLECHRRITREQRAADARERRMAKGIRELPLGVSHAG